MSCWPEFSIHGTGAFCKGQRLASIHESAGMGAAEGSG